MAIVLIVEKNMTVKTIIFNLKFSLSSYQIGLSRYLAQHFVSNRALLIVMIWFNLREVKQHTVLRSDEMCQYGLSWPYSFNAQQTS